MPELVILTGPIAAGKNTVADRLAARLAGRGHTVVVADVDAVAEMAPDGASRAALWPAAREAHAALVAQWLRSPAGYVVAITDEEWGVLARAVPDGVDPLWIVLDAPVTVTLARAQGDPTRRGLSRDPGFHRRAHERFRAMLPSIPADLTFDSGTRGADEIAAAIAETLAARRKG